MFDWNRWHPNSLKVTIKNSNHRRNIKNISLLIADIEKSFMCTSIKNLEVSLGKFMNYPYRRFRLRGDLLRRLLEWRSLSRLRAEGPL